MACTSKFSVRNIYVMCAYVCICLIVLRLPTLPLGKHLITGHVLFSQRLQKAQVIDHGTFFSKYSNLVKVNYFHRLHAVRLAELQKTRVSPRNLRLQSKQMRNIQVKRPWPTSKVLVSLVCSVLLPTFKGIYTMK